MRTLQALNVEEHNENTVMTQEALNIVGPQREHMNTRTLLEHSEETGRFEYCWNTVRTQEALHIVGTQREHMNM